MRKIANRNVADAIRSIMLSGSPVRIKSPFRNKSPVQKSNSDV